MDDEPAIPVQLMLQFLYTKQYNPVLKSGDCDSAFDRVNFQMEMYAFAEKYQVKELYSLVARHFAVAVKSINLRDPARFREHAVDLIHAVYTSTGRSADHLRDVVTATIFQRNPHRLSLLHSVEFVALADSKPEIWKDFLLGVLGLVPPSSAPPCSYRASPYALLDQDRLKFFCQDVPTNRRFWTRRVLGLTRPGMNEKETPAVLCSPVLVHKMNELRRCTNAPAFWKRWVRALLGVQCNPKLYRCKDGCGEVFEWALPTNAARDTGWPCRKCLKAKKTVDEWEDCAEVDCDDGTAADDQGDQEAEIAATRLKDCATLHHDRDVKRPQKRKEPPTDALYDGSEPCSDDDPPQEPLPAAKKPRFHNLSWAPVEEFYRFGD
ncbi:hypothetical protein DBV05_g6656 [Lasiodiplodia theobromae]|uniref:BTB domain-containing protein n=1 Tax=Lasiodiplodia theobromae TaxID=45133 RepID=A0A5N5DBE2_9PEZI|nr:hypothetical protein DBV05_g6656 [Lasiodiplodia theobromae]